MSIKITEKIYPHCQYLEQNHAYVLQLKSDPLYRILVCIGVNNTWASISLTPSQAPTLKIGKGICEFSLDYDILYEAQLTVSPLTTFE